jgi:hypothetical protein
MGHIDFSGVVSWDLITNPYAYYDYGDDYYNWVWFHDWWSSFENMT